MKKKIAQLDFLLESMFQKSKLETFFIINQGLKKRSAIIL